MPVPVRSFHDRPLWSFWAVLLLVLAVSPVTAPFSSYDLGDLFSDPSPHPGAILQIKVVHDKSIDTVTRSLAGHVQRHLAPEPCVASAQAQAPAPTIRHFPLRI